MRSYRVLPIVFGLLLTATALPAASPPQAVSPGEKSKLVQITATCPTFSWTATPGTESYEVVIYEIGEGDGQSTEILRRRLPAGATNWTPSVDSCLARGGRYAWSVKGLSKKGASSWSGPSLFQVAAGPSEADFEAALEVVRSYLATKDRGGMGNLENPAQPEGLEVETEANAAPEQLAPAADTQLSVEGNIHAASYTGDGENLENVVTDTELDTHANEDEAHHTPPTSLPPSGAAGGDLTGTYPDPTVGPDAIGSAEIVNGSVATDDLGFDPATQSEFDTHTGNIVAHHSPPTTLPPSGAAGGDLTGTYPDPTIGPNAVGSAEIVNGSVAVGDLAFDPATQAELDTLIAWAQECPDSPLGSRYSDQGDGTVTDCATGLIWLKDASCADIPNTNTSGQASWDNAVAGAAALASGTCGLTDSSAAGDWRLPTPSQFCSAYGGTAGACPASAASDSLIDSAAGPPTIAAGHPFVGVESDAYWSATYFVNGQAWFGGLSTGGVSYGYDYNSFYVWPVRGP